jgi:hypothetical protein
LKVLPLRSPVISARSWLFVCRSAFTWSTRVLSTSPLSGPPPRAIPTARDRKTDTIDTMW